MSNITAFITADANAASFTSLTAAATFADLTGALSENPKTLLAPTDTLLGIAQVPTVNRWNKQLTTNLLLAHVFGDANQLTPAPENKTNLLGDALSTSDSEVAGFDVTLEQEDPTNFIIYRLDGVIVPSSQSSLPQATTTLLDGAAPRLGSTLVAYANTDFYSVTLANLPDTSLLYDADNAFTVFLPTAEAFATLTNEVGSKPGTTEYLEAGGLETAIKNHIVLGSSAVTTQDYTNKLGNTLTVSGSSTLQVTLGSESANIANPTAVIFANGNVHDIDYVLQFPRKTTTELAVATADLSILVELITANNIDLDALNVSTVFAPVNNALVNLTVFANWYTALDVAKVLTHHVLSGVRVYAAGLPSSGSVGTALDGEVIDRADIVPTTTDILATNGNIHIVSKAIIPPTITLPSFITVVDIAVGTPTTSTLASYVALLPDTLALLSTMTAGTSFTVFAPTDEAFAKLTDADVTYLTDNNNEKLIEVLNYHVVASAVLSSGLSNGQKVLTAGNTNLTVTIDGDNVMIDDSKVVTVDQLAYNGVVHLIDSVLVPSSVTLPSTQVSSASSLTFSVLSVCVAAMAMVL